MSDNNKPNLRRSVRFSEEEVKAIEHAAERRKLSFSEVVRRQMAALVRREKDREPAR